MFIPLFFGQIAVAADCSIPIPQSMFDTKLSDVEEALRNRDSALMTQKMDQLTDAIPCLAQPVTQVQASRYHTLQGISQFLKKDMDKAQIYFSSASSANSQAKISTDFYPEGHMIHNLFTNAPEVNDGESLDAPHKGSLLFDGLNNPNRPLYRPTIYQHIQNGKSVSSALLEPGQEIPDYITEAEQEALNNKEESKTKEDKKAGGSEVSNNQGTDSVDPGNSKEEVSSVTESTNSKNSLMKPILLGTGAVSLIGGATVIYIGNKKVNEATTKVNNKEWTREQGQEILDEVKTLQTLSYIFIGVGAVGIGTAFAF